MLASLCCLARSALCQLPLARVLAMQPVASTQPPRSVSELVLCIVHLAGIIILNTLFGAFGYMLYGANTKGTDLICLMMICVSRSCRWIWLLLSLPVAAFVQTPCLCLCVTICTLILAVQGW
jgi:ABC-type multidrug transport system permease subunit